MSDFEELRSPDHGPWRASLGPTGQLILSSDDFHHDVQLNVSGDFGGAQAKLAYGRFLSSVLTRGCLRARADQELADPGRLLAQLEEAARGPQAELLELAADELARLRCALADAEAALQQLQAHRRITEQAREAQMPSAFAQALRAALSRG